MTHECGTSSIPCPDYDPKDHKFESWRKLFENAVDVATNAQDIARKYELYKIWLPLKLNRETKAIFDQVPPDADYANTIIRFKDLLSNDVIVSKRMALQNQIQDVRIQALELELAKLKVDRERESLDWERRNYRDDQSYRNYRDQCGYQNWGDYGSRNLDLPPPKYYSGSGNRRKSPSSDRHEGCCNDWYCDDRSRRNPSFSHNHRFQQSRRLSSRPRDDCQRPPSPRQHHPRPRSGRDYSNDRGQRSKDFLSSHINDDGRDNNIWDVEPNGKSRGYKK